MKLLYFVPMEIKEFDGISKKVLYQVAALRRLEIEVEICCEEIKYNKIFRKIFNKDVILEKSVSTKVTKQLLYYKYEKTLKYIFENNFDVIYIRYVYFANPCFIKFLKKIKEKNIKVIVEIPTYPYDKELVHKDMIRQIKYFIERKYREKMRNYVDKIITFSNDDEIFGIKTVKISNGIDPNEISIINKKIKRSINEINFIGVAGIAFWHGFDRFILSMAEYYKNNPKEVVKFHIVGDGNKETVNVLKNLVKENKLENYVIFYGYKSGKELDKIYNKMEVAVGSLGFSRIGLERGAPLKTREYIAKGLPIIIGYEDISLNSSIKFIDKVPNDESLFSIEKIIKWYKNLNMAPEEIRKYAENNLSWDIQMKKVVESIKELM
ncbi:glycosyltransferase [uncultured Fusobacterium sp.]|uniref:glycosyltransferase n=1 Tax=uncultured Fusobacterium sp. TaxID=159267 RepID=UPI0027DE6002|nr:glycosyltransferase [uncultured Fusobacterium sp.]